MSQSMLLTRAAFRRFGKQLTRGSLFDVLRERASVFGIVGFQLKAYARARWRGRAERVVERRMQVRMWTAGIVRDDRT